MGLDSSMEFEAFHIEKFGVCGHRCLVVDELMRLLVSDVLGERAPLFYGAADGRESLV
jgi:hypothetical protein